MPTRSRPTFNKEKYGLRNYRKVYSSVDWSNLDIQEGYSAVQATQKKPTWREGAQWLWKMRVPALVGVGTSAVTAVIFCKAVDPNLQSMMLGIGVSILYNAIALCLAIAWDVATDFHKKVQATRSSDAEPTS